VPADELGELEHGGQVGVDQVLQVLWALLFRRAGVRDSGVVDQDVDLAETAGSGPHQSLAVGGVAHVAGHRQRVPQPRGQLEVCLMPARGEDDAGARAVQHLREPSAKPGGRAGHDRDPAIERAHGTSR